MLHLFTIQLNLTSYVCNQLKCIDVITKKNILRVNTYPCLPQNPSLIIIVIMVMMVVMMMGIHCFWEPPCPNHQRHGYRQQKSRIERSKIFLR